MLKDIKTLKDVIYIWHELLLFMTIWQVLYKVGLRLRLKKYSSWIWHKLISVSSKKKWQDGFLNRFILELGFPKSSAIQDVHNINKITFKDKIAFKNHTLLNNQTWTKKSDLW